MPEYSKSDIEYKITPNDMRKMLAEANCLRDQAIISILYITGCRPSELLEMKREDIIVVQPKSDDRVRLLFTIVRKKIRKGKFQVKKRKIYVQYDPESIMQRCILAYRDKIMVGQPLFDINDSTIRKMVAKLSNRALGFQLCCYNFRHSRMTILAEQGFKPHELKYFKGSETLASVEPYLHAVPFEITIRETDDGNEIYL